MGGHLVSAIFDEHRVYLGDQVRLAALHQAFDETVKTGDVVLDLGTGTGILALMACRAGAARVYSADPLEIIELARQNCRANGFEDRVTFIKGMSNRVELPEKVDVIVSDQNTFLGYDAGALQYYSDARDRFLKPGGRMIPKGIDSYVCLVESVDAWERVELWERSPGGFDFSPARFAAVNNRYSTSFYPEHLLSSPVLLESLDFLAAKLEPKRLEASMVASRSGVIHGVAGVFTARLSDTVKISNSPLATPRMGRTNTFFPIEHPVALEKGDRVNFTVRAFPAELTEAWKVDIRSAAGDKKANFSQCTMQGMPISKESLMRAKPDFVPKLTKWGQARLHALSLCDGHRTVPEIEQELSRRYPEYFSSPANADGFVAKIISKYSM